MNCNVCRDGFRNYFFRPLRCPHENEEDAHPEEEAVVECLSNAFRFHTQLIDRPDTFTALCGCEYPRWCRLVSSREWIDDDLFEITSPERSCCCCPRRQAEVR